MGKLEDWARQQRKTLGMSEPGESTPTQVPPMRFVNGLYETTEPYEAIVDGKRCRWDGAKGWVEVKDD